MLAQQRVYLLHSKTNKQAQQNLHTQPRKNDPDKNSTLTFSNYYQPAINRFRFYRKAFTIHDTLNQMFLCKHTNKTASIISQLLIRKICCSFLKGNSAAIRKMKFSISTRKAARTLFTLKKKIGEQRRLPQGIFHLKYKIKLRKRSQ